MPSENGVYASVNQFVAHVLVVSHHIFIQQLGFLVEMLNQVVVHHRHHSFALCACRACLVGNPAQRGILDAPGGVVGVHRVATSLQQVFLVTIAVDAYHHQPLHRFSRITQRGGVALHIATVAEVRVDVAKLLTSNGGGCATLLVVEIFGVGVADVVVARNHQHLDALGAQALKLACHKLMAQSLAVFREVARNHHNVGALFNDFSNHRAQNLGALLNHTHIGSGILVNSRATFLHKHLAHGVNVAHRHNFYCAAHLHGSHSQ